MDWERYSPEERLWVPHKHILDQELLHAFNFSGLSMILYHFVLRSLRFPVSGSFHFSD